MPNPLHEPNYQIFRMMLVEAREKARLTQVDVAKRLDKPQSFVSKYERGERRLDFVEFLLLAEAINLDTEAFLADFMSQRKMTNFK